jgi:ATP-dependent DNA helicase RecG
VDLLQQDIVYLKGVGEKKAKVFKSETQISSYQDLLLYYPYRYVDKSHFVRIVDIDSEDVYIQIKGTFSSPRMEGQPHKERLIYTFKDESGSIDIIFFKGLKWIKQSLLMGRQYVIFGKPSRFQHTFNFIHPDIELYSSFVAEQEKQSSPFVPLYNTTEKMKNSFLNSKAITKIMRNLIYEVSGYIPENLPSYIVQRYKLMSHNDALVQIHFPQTSALLANARARIKFEELLFMQLEHQLMRSTRQEQIKGFIFSKVGNNFNEFYYKHLPFSLTDAQKRVIKEIREDMRSGHQMNRLLQGDVGSGKTLVALICMLIAVDNGFQATIMAPTEILAEQHLKAIQNFLGSMPLKVTLLTGNTKAKERDLMLAKLKEGTIDILIGTHALLEERVVFNNLGLCVIDEQHRFGVKQRATMWSKNSQCPPHILVMTATPIPRTLAMSVYGDLDISIINELPAGRKPVQTTLLYDKDVLKLFAFMHHQVDQGRQIYIVFPLIEESEKLDLKNLMEGYVAVEREFPLPKYHLGIVHGKMKAETKDYEMDLFKRGITNILVSTTVIEVGVDVPNATVMVIENAERFGLSQLHQLRGRVGRGASQSYCILMASYKLTTDAKKRLETICHTTDGFVLAEEDLRLRGPGSIAGTAQSGILDLKLADIVRDEPLLKEARHLAIEIIEQDRTLAQEKNSLLYSYFQTNKSFADFSKIS